MIVSLLYAMICGILFLDGCWLATIYTWAIKQLSRGATRGVMDFVFVILVVAVWIIFLLAGFYLWVWATWVTMRQLLELWTGRGGTVKEVPLAGSYGNTESK